MAQDVNIAVKVETKDASKNVENLGKSFDGLQKQTKSVQDHSASFGKELANNGQVMGKLSQATGGFSDVIVKSVKGIDLANISLKGLKGAIVSTGIGVFVILLGELVNQLMELYSSTVQSEKALSRYNDVLEKSNELHQENIDAIEQSAKISRIYGEAQGKSAKELFDNDMNYLAQRKAKNEEYVQEQIANNYKILQDDKLNDEDRKQALEKNNANLKKGLDNRLALVREGQIAEANEYKRGVDEKKKAEDEAQKKSEDLIEKNKQAKIQSITALRNLEKKYQDDIENIADKTGQQKLDRQKERALEELALIKLSESDKAKARELIQMDFASKQEVFDIEQENKRNNLQLKFETEKADLLAKSETEKLLLKEQRESEALEKELLTLEVSETAKNDLRKQLKEKFALEQQDLIAKTNESDALESQKVLEDIMNDNTSTLEQKQSALNEELLMIENQKNAKVISEETYNAKVKVLADARKKISDLEIQQNKAKVKAIGDGLATLASLAGENTALGKTLAVASTTIKTYESATNAYSGMTESIPGPVGIAAGIVAAAASVAMGISNVQKILAVKTPSGGGGGGAPSGGGGAPPPANFNVVGASSTNQLAETINASNKASDKPMKAYVVSGDVTTGQTLDSKIVKNATLGKG